MAWTKPRAGPTNAASRKAISTGLPHDVTRFIKGTEIDLSTASRYWRRYWDVVKECVSQQWEAKGESQYKLRPPFFRVFAENLHEVVKQHFGRSPMNGAELMANALFRAAYAFARPQLPPLDRSDYRRLWPADRPTSEAWQRLGTLSVPGGSIVVLEDPGPGSPLRIANPRDPRYPRIAVYLNWSNNKEAIPKLTIQIEGEPVCVLMKAGYELRDVEARRATRKEARRIWDSLNRWISTDFGIQRLKGGRPPDHFFGREAAYLHDHKGLSWRQVAQELCQKKHVHDHACRENFRKLAEQCWKKEQRHALAQIGGRA